MHEYISSSQINETYNKEIQVLTNLLHIKQTDNKNNYIFIPQQSEIHVHVCLTTIGIVTYRAQNDNVHTVALFLIFIVYFHNVHTRIYFIYELNCEQNNNQVSFATFTLLRI